MSDDDTQDHSSEPGNPDVIGARNHDWTDPPPSAARSPLVPAVKSPYPPTRVEWFDVDGIHEVQSTLPNAERRLLDERIERIVLRLQETPQYLTNVETLLGLDGLAAQHIGA